MTAPHPQRCETCKFHDATRFDGKIYFGECRKTGEIPAPLIKKDIYTFPFGLCCHSSVQSPIPNDEQCRICSQSERDKMLDEKELQYLNCLIKDDIASYPDGWCTLPHVDPILRQSVLAKIESLRSIPGSKEGVKNKSA